MDGRFAAPQVAIYSAIKCTVTAVTPVSCPYPAGQDGRSATAEAPAMVRIVAIERDHEQRFLQNSDIGVTGELVRGRARSGQR